MALKFSYMNSFIKGLMLISFIKIGIASRCQDLQANTYLIKKIDSTSNHYLIRAIQDSSKNDSVLIIVQKVDTVNRCNCSLKILVGNRYRFIIDNFLEKEF